MAENEYIEFYDPFFDPEAHLSLPPPLSSAPEDPQTFQERIAALRVHDFTPARMRTFLREFASICCAEDTSGVLFSVLAAEIDTAAAASDVFAQGHLLRLEHLSRPSAASWQVDIVGLARQKQAYILLRRLRCSFLAMLPTPPPILEAHAHLSRQETGYSAYRMPLVLSYVDGQYLRCVQWPPEVRELLDSRTLAHIEPLPTSALTEGCGTVVKSVLPMEWREAAKRLRKEREPFPFLPPVARRALDVCFRASGMDRVPPLLRRSLAQLIHARAAMSDRGDIGELLPAQLMRPSACVLCFVLSLLLPEDGAAAVHSVLRRALSWAPEAGERSSRTLVPSDARGAAKVLAQAVLADGRDAVYVPPKKRMRQKRVPVVRGTRKQQTTLSSWAVKL